MLSSTRIDDWALFKLTAPQRCTLLELLKDRHERRFTMVTSQLSVEPWHKIIGERDRMARGSESSSAQLRVQPAVSIGF